VIFVGERIAFEITTKNILHNSKRHCHLSQWTRSLGSFHFLFLFLFWFQTWWYLGDSHFLTLECDDDFSIQHCIALHGVLLPPPNTKLVVQCLKLIGTQFHFSKSQ
jgi:hypothetical protein